MYFDNVSQKVPDEDDDYADDFDHLDDEKESNHCQKQRRFPEKTLSGWKSFPWSLQSLRRSL